MSVDPIRLTYMVIDGNKTGAFGRIKILERDYQNLIGLDLVDLLRDQLGFSRRSSDVHLFKAELVEQAARKLLDQYEQYHGHLPFIPVKPFEKLDSYWASSPATSQVHLLIEILPGGD